MQKKIITAVNNYMINNGCHKHVCNVEIYNSKPSSAGCMLCSQLPNNLKHTGNNSQLKKKYKDIHIKGCYYSIEDFPIEEFCDISC